MIDAMQTIRGYVQEAHDYMEDGMSSYKWQQAYGFICKALASITAIDSLAVAPSEEAVELVRSIRDGRYGLSADQATALIQARDERIRRECEKMIQKLSDNLGDGSGMMTPEERAMDQAYDLAIEAIKTEAANGQ